MNIMSLKEFIRQQETEPQESENQEAVVMRLGDFIDALKDQISDKDRLLEVSEDPETGIFAVRVLPQEPESEEEDS